MLVAVLLTDSLLGLMLPFHLSSFNCVHKHPIGRSGSSIPSNVFQATEGARPLAFSVAQQWLRRKANKPYEPQMFRGVLYKGLNFWQN